MPKRRGRTCEVCGTTYDATYPAQRTCGRACGVKINARVLNAAPKPERTPRSAPVCRTCGHVGTGANRWTAHCSQRCRIDEVNQRVTTMYRLARSLGCGTVTWHNELCRRLADRDGSTCGICARPVDLDIPVSGSKGDNDGPSLDHVVPWSRGGADTVENLRLTHWRCNRDRQAS